MISISSSNYLYKIYLFFPSQLGSKHIIYVSAAIFKFSSHRKKKGVTSSLESWRCGEQQDGYGGRWRGRQKELRAETFIVKMIRTKDKKIPLRTRGRKIKWENDQAWWGVGGGTVRRKVKPRGGWPTVRGYSCTVWRPFDKSYLNYSFRLNQKFVIMNFCHRKYIRLNIY